MSGGFSFTFYVEGLPEGRAIRQLIAATEKQARQQLWAALSEEEKDRVIQIECLDKDLA